jgi:hypothetical protein
MPESGSEPTSLLEKGASVVPTLYYDIIARIIPGSAFIAAVSWDKSHAVPEWINAGQVGSGLLFVCFSYLAGMLLTSISVLLFDLAIWQLLSIFIPGLWSPWAISENIDELSATKPAAAAELLKMFGEATLFENALAGVIVCLSYDRLHKDGLAIVQDYPGPIVTVAILAALGLVFRVWGLNSRAKKLSTYHQIEPPQAVARRCLAAVRATLKREASLPGDSRRRIETLLHSYDEKVKACEAAAGMRNGKLEMLICVGECAKIVDQLSRDRLLSAEILKSVKKNLTAVLGV